MSTVRIVTQQSVVNVDTSEYVIKVAEVGMQGPQGEQGPPGRDGIDGQAGLPEVLDGGNF